MKLVWFTRKIQACFLCSGLLALAASLFLSSVSPAQLGNTMIAFASERNWDWKVDEKRNSEIYLMNSNGKQIRQLTEVRWSDEEPAWSPAGQKITFVSHRDMEQIPDDEILRGEIYLMNADGTNPINLTQSLEKPDIHPSWSPDGQQITFTSIKLRNKLIFSKLDIWVMDADGGNPRNLTDHDAGGGTPAWSPDGQQIAFTSKRHHNVDIYVMDRDGANLTRLTNHRTKDGMPDWSPDGQQIAFTSVRKGNPDIYVMNADGTNPINLTNHPAEDSNPSWAPDGTRIAFDSDRDGNLEIYVMDADGANPINLTNHPAWDSGPSWGPAPTLNVSPKRKLTTTWGKLKSPN